MRKFNTTNFIGRGNLGWSGENDKNKQPVKTAKLIPQIQFIIVGDKNVEIGFNDGKINIGNALARRRLKRGIKRSSV